MKTTTVVWGMIVGMVWRSQKAYDVIAHAIQTGLWARHNGIMPAMDYAPYKCPDCESLHLPELPVIKPPIKVV